MGERPYPWSLVFLFSCPFVKVLSKYEMLSLIYSCFDMIGLYDLVCDIQFLSKDFSFLSTSTFS